MGVRVPLVSGKVRKASRTRAYAAAWRRSLPWRSNAVLLGGRGGVANRTRINGKARKASPFGGCCSWFFLPVHRCSRGRHQSCRPCCGPSRWRQCCDRPRLAGSTCACACSAAPFARVLHEAVLEASSCVVPRCPPRSSAPSPSRLPPPSTRSPGPMRISVTWARPSLSLVLVLRRAGNVDLLPNLGSPASPSHEHVDQPTPSPGVSVITLAWGRPGSATGLASAHPAHISPRFLLYRYSGHLVPRRYVYPYPLPGPGCHPLCAVCARACVSL